MIQTINRILPHFIKETFFWKISRYFNKFYLKNYDHIKTNTHPPIHLKGLATDTISQQILFTGYYDDNLTQFIQKIGRNGGTFVDVGANIGYCSNLFAAQNKNNIVYSFEPSLSNLELLKHNINLNHLKQQIQVLDVAVGQVESEMYFENGPKEQTGWGHLSTEKTGQKVKVITLDLFFKEISTPIDLLKIDVEGFDLQVILGARELLQKGLIKNIIFEYHHELLINRVKLSEEAKQIIELFELNQYEIKRFAAHDYLVQKKLKKD